MRPILLEARQLVCGPEIQQVSLAVRAGSLVSLLGPGTAKLIRILGFLEPPESGELYVEGRWIPPHELAEGRKLAGFDPASRPRILLADRPADLDGLLALHARGQTVVYATLDPLAAARAQELYRLRDGRLYRLNE
jgi:predicted ABC-type transport system involved in lysophospholipase L1 biosynthesis ATPase subunit